LNKHWTKLFYKIIAIKVILFDDPANQRCKFSYKLINLQLPWRNTFCCSKSGNPNKWFTTLSHNVFDRQQCVSVVSVLPCRAEPEVREAASGKRRKSKMGLLLLSLNRIGAIARRSPRRSPWRTVARRSFHEALTQFEHRSAIKLI